MPLNTVSDPITDKEAAFAHLILSGTMNDRRAARTAGLDPGAAAATKAKPRVHDYISRLRAAEQEKSVQPQAEGPLTLGREQTLSREQILARLWQLAGLSPEATRNNIAGQIKALAMIVAIEGLIPDRRHSAVSNEPTAPSHPTVYRAAWLREQQPPHEDTPSAEAKPAAPHAIEPEPPPTQPAPEVNNHPPAPNHAQASPNLANPLLQPQRMSWVPEATGSILDAVADQANSLRRPFFPKRGFPGGRR